MGPGQLGEETPPVKVRTFFGLPLPQAQREALAAYLHECAQRAPDFRWTPPENLHLTIRFLGHVELTLAEGDIGSFKRSRLVRVVWLGLTSGEDEIKALAAKVEAECGSAGLEPEARRFNAHLTLARARARDGASLPELPPAPDLAAWRADELILYRSRLGRAGSLYEPLRRIRLS